MSILFTPYQIGSLQIKNRFVRSSTVECLSTPENDISEKYLKIYERLAKGNVGLIITGNYFISQDGRAVDKVPSIDNDHMIVELRKLTELMHQYDSKIIAQINHGGRQSNPKLIKQKPIAPSKVTDKLNGVTPKPMSEREINRVIDDFGKAALRVKKAGFDGIQINAAHGYLISQFLSQYTNKRKDKWGGSFENRMRFLLCIYEKIRKNVGNDFPVLIKLNAVDEFKKGIQFNETINLCIELNKRGIDAIEVSGGIKETGFATTKGLIPEEEIKQNLNAVKKLGFYMKKHQLRKNALFTEGYYATYAAAIRKEIDAPIIAVGGLRTKAFMESIIEKGKADFVALSRPFIRYPNLVNQLAKSNEQHRTFCYNCNKCTYEITQNYKPLKCYIKAN